jgi:hypothetical protein
VQDSEATEAFAVDGIAAAEGAEVSVALFGKEFLV